MINENIDKRYSPRAFSDKKVENKLLDELFQAASYAASAFNEQPWRFVYATKENSEEYTLLLNCLVEWNQKWASNADVLVLNIAKRNFTHNNKPNATYEYDLGQAVAFMSIEAVNQGLFSHQMTGFDPEKAAENFNIDDDFKIVSVIAIGYYGNAEELPEDMINSELEERNRKSFDSIVFEEGFNDK